MKQLIIPRFLLGFNSIKVRLIHSNLTLFEYVVEFQFHKGSINTFWIIISALLMICFNSIKVRLILVTVDTTSINHSAFQFHKGSINTSVIKRITEKIQWFQFHKGSINTGCWSFRL